MLPLSSSKRVKLLFTLLTSINDISVISPPLTWWLDTSLFISISSPSLALFFSFEPLPLGNLKKHKRNKGRKLDKLQIRINNQMLEKSDFVIPNPWTYLFNKYFLVKLTTLFQKIKFCLLPAQHLNIQKKQQINHTDLLMPRRQILPILRGINLLPI